MPSEYQDKYERKMKKSKNIMISNIDDKIDRLQDNMRDTEDNEMRRALQARIDALKVKKKSYKEDDPIIGEEEFEEEAQASVSTASVGSPTMSTSDGGTAPAAFGSSHIYAPKIGGIASRKGDVNGKKKKNKDKKRKKKKNESFLEHYFMEDVNKDA